MSSVGGDDNGRRHAGQDGGNSDSDGETGPFSAVHELLFGSPDFKLDETHVSKLIGMDKIFNHHKCHSCDKITEDITNLEVTAQTQLVHLNAEKVKNQQLKDKLEHLEKSLRKGGSALINLKSEVENGRREKHALEEKLRLKMAPVQAQAVSTTTAISDETPTSSTMSRNPMELHGLDKTKGMGAHFCRCGVQCRDVGGLYCHLNEVMVSGRNAGVICTLCGQKLTTWNGLVKHASSMHGKGILDLLQNGDAN